MNLSFSTARLNVFEISKEITQSEQVKLLNRLPELLTPAVVANLPPYFHQINSPADAQVWLERMLAESRLFVVTKNNSDLAIGFIFVFVENDSDVHIGYLLGEAYWKQGLASELLSGFIQQVAQTESWVKLIGGVERSNIGSARLLEKLGFVGQSDSESDVVFYEYRLC